MKQLLFTLLLLVLFTCTISAQYNQTVVNNYNTISAMNNEADRKVYFATLSSNMKIDLWKYHIDKKLDDWGTSLSWAQENALYTVKGTLTYTLGSDAETLSESNSAFNSFRNAVDNLDSYFSSTELVEIKTLGSVSSSYNFMELYEEIFYDETNEVFVHSESLEECARTRICSVVCNCNLDSLCDTCWGGNCRPLNGWGGCGCFYLFSCNGKNGRKN